MDYPVCSRWGQHLHLVECDRSFVSREDNSLWKREDYLLCKDRSFVSREEFSFPKNFPSCISIRDLSSLFRLLCGIQDLSSLGVHIQFITLTEYLFGEFWRAVIGCKLLPEAI